MLVTGGAGFIGSELTAQLVAAGADVCVVDNLVNGRRDNLEGLLGASCRLEAVDIRDESRMASLLAGIDRVYHLACLGVRHSLHSPSENHAVNASATLSLLELSRAAGIRRFVYVSSSEVYGTARTVPMTEEHPTFPMTVYGASKLAGECYARAYHRTYGLATVVVRPFNSYGPRSHHEGDSGEVIPKFLLRCWAGEPMVIFGDGRQTRDFTCVRDTARGILLAGVCDGAVGQTINLGSGVETSVEALAREVAALLGCEDPRIEYDPPRPGDVLRLLADSSRAREVLGFRPELGLREGLAELLQWYRDRGADPRTLLVEERRQNWRVEA